MYHVHSVRAYVCRTLPRGEADALVDLAVDGLGFVRAIAKGIRFEKSKSRYAVTELSFIECELVRGKEMWRMIKARVAHDAPAVASQLTLDARRALSRVARLAYTVCDEDATREPYASLCACAQALSRGIRPEHVETIAVARILSALGYLDAHPFPFLYSENIGEDSDAHMELHGDALIESVNKAIRSATG